MTQQHTRYPKRNLHGFASLVRQRLAKLGEQGVSRAEVARRYGHDVANFDWYTTEVSAPTVAHVDALARALEVHPNELRALLGFALLPSESPVSQAERIRVLAESLTQARVALEAAETQMRALQQV